MRAPEHSALEWQPQLGMQIDTAGARGSVASAG
jgi:hypothetical protein